ncbi:MAG TPA: DUF3341 domain-containing protein [Polyangiales bacterium]|nr:DUF3341 domain-containing protein [Polyangiales bacterium]
MAEHPKGSAMLAEFSTEQAIVAATRALRERGYSALDTVTPRPIEELQQLIAPERSTLPRTVFIAGLLGAITGLGVQWFCNTWDYPLNVGGRPAFSLPAFIPITFEIMVLFAGLAAFFGVLHRMHLPRLAHPQFDAPGIESASIDRFWLVVEDTGFDRQETERLLVELGGERVATVAEGAKP